MNDVTRYADMKDSGVEWLGQIPRHWETIKVKYIANKLERGTSPDYTEEELQKVVNQATFSKGYWDEENIRYSKIPGSESRGLLVKEDVLLASTGNGVLGKVYYFDINGEYVADGHVTIIRSDNKKYCSKFLYYCLFINYELINFTLARGSTNQTELQRNLLGGWIVPKSDVIEQKKIVSYLDDQCAKIDDIIAEARTSIEEYKKWKTSVIYEAVTKGLDPHEEMKDSGVEWIGKIPKHWKTIKVKYIANKLERGTAPDYTEEELQKVVNQATFSKGYWDEVNIRYSRIPANDSRGLLVK